MAVPPRNGLASLPVMVVSLISKTRWALVAGAWLLLAPPRAWAEAPASAPPAAVQPPAPAPAAPTTVLPGSDLPDTFASEALPPEEPESLGWSLVRTVLLLLAVLASIYLTLNVGLRRLMGLQGVSVGRKQLVTVVERVPLDQRRALFVLKAADEYLLVGSGEGGLQLLSKLDTQAVERIQAERSQPAANVVHLSPFLQKLLSRRTGSTPPRS
jgi:flagellar protein FliO/FliZ